MAYQWESCLESGYEKVDNQHRQLFAAVNNLAEASARGKGGKAVMETLEFLTGYTIKHFSDEEELQVQFNYPDYLVHKRIHTEFKGTVGDLVERVIKDGPTEELIGEVCSIVGSWILNHIKGDDFRMVAFIKAAAVKKTKGKS